APEVVADEILDEDRQQFRLVERGVRLPERIVDRRPYLPLHLEPMKAAGWCRRRLVVQRREELFNLLPLANHHAKCRSFVEGSKRDGRRLLERFLDLVE